MAAEIAIVWLSRSNFVLSSGYKTMMYHYRKLPAALFVLVLTWVPQAYSIPIIDLLTPAGSSPDFLMVVTAGRDHGPEFSNVAQLIASGRGQELVNQGSRVLTLDPNSGLAYEARGVGYLMLRDLDSAIADFENAARLDPAISGPLSKMGLALMENDRLEAADQAFQLALRVEPNDRFAHRNLGLLYDSLNRPEEAIPQLLEGIGDSRTGFEFEATVLARLLNERRVYTQAIDVLAPRIPMTHADESAQIVLATAMLGAKQWQNALDRFDRALAINPGSTVSQMGRAVALRGVGLAEQSIEILQGLGSNQGIERQVAVELTLSYLAAGREEDGANTRADAIDKGANPNALDDSIAQLYLDTQRFEEAQLIYQALIDRDAGTGQAYVNLSELYFSEGRVDDAQTLLKTGKQRFPSNPYLPFRLGNSYASVGEYADAVIELSGANELAPNNRDILRALSLVHTRLGNFDEAVSAALSLEQLFPNDLDTLVFIALAYERAGDTSNAINTYERAYSIQAENVLVLNNLANLLIETGEHDRALVLIEIAAENVPENSVVLDTLGFVKFQLGEYQAAIDVFDQAISLVPKLAIAHYHRGLALAQLNRNSDAKQAFEQALEFAPSANWTSEALEQLSRL